jgi:hypothetical protein
MAVAYKNIRSADYKITKILVFDRVKKNHSPHPAWIFGIFGSATNFCKAAG